MHKTLEQLKHVDPTKRPSHDEAFAKFKELFVERASKLPCRANTSVDALVVAADKIIRRIDDVEQLRDGKVVFNELQLLDEIDRNDGVKIKFKGYVDVGIVTSGKRGSKLWLCDYKTATWGWGGDKRFDARVHRQLLLYKHFVCKRQSLDPKNVGLAFVILKKTPRGSDSPIEWLPIGAGPKVCEAAIEHVQSDVTAMRAGVYMAKAAACFKYASNPCPYVGSDLCPVGCKSLKKSG